MTLLGLLVLIIIVGVVLWGAGALLTAFAVPDPIRTVIWVILVILVLVVIASQVGLLGGVGIRIR